MYFTQIVGGFFTLLQGMWVTLMNLFRKPVTQQYPHEQPTLSPAFRSAIILLPFADKEQSHDCIACMQCVRICPSYCIEVEGTRHDGVKGKRAAEFRVDYALCSVCGLCLDVCPTNTLGYSKIYDVVGFDRKGFTYDLLDGFRESEARYVARMQAMAATEAQAAAAAQSTKGEPGPRPAGGEGTASPEKAGDQ